MMPGTQREMNRFNLFVALTSDNDAVGLPGDLILAHLSKHDQLNLRQCSRDAAQFVEERMLPDLFSALHISCVPSAVMQLRLAPRALRYVATYCRELVIHVTPQVAATASGPGLTRESNNLESTASVAAGHAVPPHGSLRPHRPPPPPPRPPPSRPPSIFLQYFNPTTPCGTPENWRHLLNALSNLSVVTISCHQMLPWEGYSSVEQSLIALREALESATLSYMTTLRLDPIHAMGLLHFRWAGGAAYGSAHWSAGRLWRRLSVLDLTLANPARVLGHDQQHTLIKVLHDYLHSFTHTLAELSFRWADVPGPSPVFLDELAATAARRTKSRVGVSAFSAPPLHWPQLRKLALWNCQWDLGQIEALFAQRAPTLEECAAGADMMLTDDAPAMARLDALGVSHQLFFCGSSIFAPASQGTRSDGEDAWYFTRHFPRRSSAAGAAATGAATGAAATAAAAHAEQQCGLNVSGYLADDDMDADEGLADDLGISSGGEDEEDVDEEYGDEDIDGSGSSSRSSASLADDTVASAAGSDSGAETPPLLLPVVYVPGQQHAGADPASSAYEADEEEELAPSSEKEDDEQWGEIPIMLATG